MNYDLVPAYTMKCRLYLNKTQVELFEKALAGVRTYYNCTLWEMFNNLECTRAVDEVDKDKKKTGGIVHFPDLKKAKSAEWKHRLTLEHPIIECAPAGAITTNCGCILADMKRSLGNCPVEKQKPIYYNARHQRTSYTYQEACSKIEAAENQNVLYITLNKIGRCKIRGWNQKIRFDEKGETDFLAYCAIDKKKQLTITVSKDNCGDHWICFKLQNVYKPMDKPTNGAVGVDVGIKDIAILSNGEKKENKRFKQKNKRRLKLLNRKMSRRQGWANGEFRAAHKKDKTLKPSNGYERAALTKAKIERQIKRQRDDWNNNITREIVQKNAAIAVESLNVKGMFRNRHLAYALSDAAIGEILEQLKYKAAWHGRDIREIGRWTPSSKRCSCCGQIKDKLTLSERFWTCPKCGTRHDRDINAAINILYYAYSEELAA